MAMRATDIAKPVGVNWRLVSFHCRLRGRRGMAAKIERELVDKVGPWIARRSIWPDGARYRHFEHAPETAAERLGVSLDVLTRFVTANPRPIELANRLIYQGAFDFVDACRSAERAGRPAPACPPTFPERWEHRSSSRLALLPVFDLLASVNAAEVSDARLFEVCCELCGAFLARADEVSRRRSTSRPRELMRKYLNLMRSALEADCFDAFDRARKEFERLAASRLLEEARDLQHAARQLAEAILIVEGRPSGTIKPSVWKRAGLEHVKAAEVIVDSPGRRGPRSLAAANKCILKTLSIFQEVTGQERGRWSESIDGRWQGDFGLFASRIFELFQAQPPSKKLLQNATCKRA